MIKFERDDRGVAQLQLNRPEVRNAFNAELMEAIVQKTKQPDVGTRVIVLSGAGKIFCAGADLKWMRGGRDSGLLREVFEAVDNCPVPVIARVHGAAIAGATGLVAACDLAVAAETTVFAFTEVRLGLVPAVISPYVVRKTGYAFARAAFMTAERFDARRAFEAGLIHRVVAEDKLDETVDSYVDALLAGAPGALVKARNLVNDVTGRRPAEAKSLTVEALSAARFSEEGQEGVAAFLEKRLPSWIKPR